MFENPRTIVVDQDNNTFRTYNICGSKSKHSIIRYQEKHTAIQLYLVDNRYAVYVQARTGLEKRINAEVLATYLQMKKIMNIKQDIHTLFKEHLYDIIEVNGTKDEALSIAIKHYRIVFHRHDVGFLSYDKINWFIL